MHLPLVKCYWCENCQSVIDSAKTCEGCGSSLSIVALSIWMDRGGMARALTTQETMRAVTETGKRTLRRGLRIVEADTDAITPYHNRRAQNFWSHKTSDQILEDINYLLLCGGHVPLVVDTKDKPIPLRRLGCQICGSWEINHICLEQVRSTNSLGA